MIRKISNEFETELLSGTFNDLLEFVKLDNTLDMEIRNNCINIYYRGGIALKVELIAGSFHSYFDDKYPFCYSTFFNEIEQNLINKNWMRYFAFTKQFMDLYLSSNQNNKREFQQLVVRENNYSSIANGTDYFIIDIEYDELKNTRFDIVAVEWISETSKRKLLNYYKPRIIVFKMKYGNRAFTWNSGMDKHLEDFKKFISNKISVQNFKQEILEVFKQKRKLGLIPCLSDSKNNTELEEFDDEIGYAFLIANHDPDSRTLVNQIKSLENHNATFITANFCGYGLYKNNLVSLKDILYRIK